MSLEARIRSTFYKGKEMMKYKAVSFLLKIRKQLLHNCKAITYFLCFKQQNFPNTLELYIILINIVEDKEKCWIFKMENNIYSFEVFLFLCFNVIVIKMGTSNGDSLLNILLFWDDMKGNVLKKTFKFVCFLLRYL